MGRDRQGSWQIFHSIWGKLGFHDPSHWSHTHTVPELWLQNQTEKPKGSPKNSKQKSTNWWSHHHTIDKEYLLDLSESDDGLIWLLQVNDLWVSEKIEFSLRDDDDDDDGFRSLKEMSGFVGEWVSDFGLASFREEEDMVLRAEIEQAIIGQVCLLFLFTGMKE